MPLENPLIFYPRCWEIADTHVRMVAFYLYLHRIRRKVERDNAPYFDRALIPVAEDDDSTLPSAPPVKQPTAVAA